MLPGLVGLAGLQSRSSGISFVGSLPYVGAANAGNVTLTFSNFRDAAGNAVTLLEDDLILVANADSGSSDRAISTSSSNWTIFGEGFVNNTFDLNFAALRKFMGSTPDTGIVLNGATVSGATAHGAIAFALRGVNLTTPLDVAIVSASGASARPNPALITPASTGAWIVAMGFNANGTGGSYTLPGDLSATTNHFRTGSTAETNDVSIGMGIKTDWASGAFDPAVWTGGPTILAGDSWAALTIALRPA